MRRFHAPGFQFSAYLKSPYVTVLHNRGVLDVAEMTPAIQTAYENAQDSIKAHFRARQLETAKSEIEQWKSERVYPYSEEPVSTLDIIRSTMPCEPPTFVTGRSITRSEPNTLACLRSTLVKD